MADDALRRDVFGSVTMANGTLRLWALETANRVKMVQASWSDDDQLARQETVRQELRRSLAEFSGSERASRLQALKSYFPVWDQAETKVVEVEREGPPRKLSPQELLDQLVSAFPTLTERERQSFSQRLADAGYKLTKTVEVAASAAPPALAQGLEFLPEPTLRKLTESDPTARKPAEKAPVRVYPAQVFNVLHELLDCTLTLAAASQGTIDEMYRRADLPVARDRDDAQLRAAILRYLKGEPGGAPDQMRQAVQKVRGRVAGMLPIPARLPDKMCERLVRLLDPAGIMRNVEKEGFLGGLVKDPKVRCWDKYAMVWKNRGLGQTQDSTYWELEYAKDVVSIVEGQNTPK